MQSDLSSFIRRKLPNSIALAKKVMPGIDRYKS
jgi:hypothetical protein